MHISDLDSRVRLAAFAFLSEQTLLHGEVLARDTLAIGFEFEGRRVPLIGPQGIFKPAVLPAMPLSITTVPAAHILPDGDPRGEPIVSNGLALCTLHHAAFDRHVLGIKPDLTVDLRIDILREADGPMLRHGLQGFQGAPILVPRHADSRPNRGFLAERYELFKKAG